jgi:hypothetical protein
MQKISGKKWKLKGKEVEIVGSVKNESIEKLIVKVKERGRGNVELEMFGTIGLYEFLKLINEEKLETRK